MAAVVLLLTVTLGTIYVSDYLSLKRQNADMLDRYMGLYSLEALPGESLPQLPQDVPGDLPGPAGGVELPAISPPGEDSTPVSDGALFMLSSFYSAAFSESGEVLAVDTGKNGLYSEEDIIEYAEKILSRKKSSGKMTNLIYRVEEREGYTLAAFMDTTYTENSMGKLLLYTLTAGILSAGILLAASVFLARRIVKPLEDNDKRQKQFISDAEHELKTPVSVISANAELLARQTGDNEWLSNIRYENERMGNLVKELLELSRAENMPFQTETVDFSQLAAREVLPFESVAFEHGLTISSRIEEGLFVNGSSRMLEQLISILMDNAVSHASGEGTINVSLRRERKSIVFCVENPGEAIPEESREHLFDRFYRTDEARKCDSVHYGLGLPIAKAVTESHKGKISLTCHDGVVAVTVRLPAASVRT